MTEDVGRWFPEVAEAIEALNEGEWWKAYRRRHLAEIERRFDLRYGTWLGDADASTVEWVLARERPSVTVQVAHPGWRPERPRRRMPTVIAIAQYWAGRAPFEYVRLDEPRCFGCRRPAEEWSGTYFERAHLVDRYLGGLDHAGNLALLCSLCHRVMPTFEIDQGADAIDWVRRGALLVELPALVAQAGEIAC